ncbi:MAG: PilC/PilY family type IV pilus protein, partial [Proteobacteria bacterium]|nr:PilC/PilY family type IV pilus protein [Pseudomonadota bacterium]
GSGASLAANSTKLDTGTTTYQAVYFSGEWRGDLRAFAVNPSSGVIAATATWEATAQLPTAANRVIKTCKNTCTGEANKINFDTTDATAAQRTALASTTAAQDDLINYLRGSQALEALRGGTLRDRSTPLGDIVNSQPVFVGAPDPNLYFNKSFTGSDSYFAFTASNVSRKRRIYVASNDGMMHGFSAETATETGQPTPGQETFAYLPSAVIRGNLKNLSNPVYGSGVAHEFFNDGELTVSDVYLDGLGGCTGSACWRTVLVGTTGRGLSKAIYALDVTNPADVKFLWERSPSDSTDIGQIVGKPVIAQTANGVWSVLIGNGYNSADNKPALLQINVQTGALTVYETTGSATNDGLAPPAVWIGNLAQNISTEAYAGDLNGNVWKFDLTTPGSNGTKIYTAKDSSGNIQPITAGMIAGKNPKVTSEVWVFFGTGSVLADFSPSTNVQTWYGLIVQGSNAVGATSVRGDLRQRTINSQFAADATRPLATRTISTPTANDMVGKKGWYIDLVKPNPDRNQTLAQGERMVTPNQFQGALLLGTSRIPADSATFNPCNPSGTGWIMAIDPFTGAPGSSNFFDVNNDGSFNNNDNAGGGNEVSAGVGFDSITNNGIFVGNTMLLSFDDASTSRVNTSGTLGEIKRLSWRELVTQ